MKFLVTGATGFIGKSLVNLLLDQGHSILAISRKKIFELQHDKIIWIQSSLQLDESSMDRIRAFGPEVLIHLAWEKIPDFSFETSVENLNHQMAFFRNIFKINSLEKIIVTGSCWEYNKKIGFCVETENVVSSNYFTWAKNSLRDFLQFESLQNNITFIWARLFYVYGPDQRAGSLIPTLIEKLISKKIPELQTPKNANDFIHVDDVAVGILVMATKIIESGIYNLGSGISTSVNEVSRIVEIALSGKDFMTKELVRKTINSEKTVDFSADIQKSLISLNWVAKIGLSEGIKTVINKKYF